LDIIIRKAELIKGLRSMGIRKGEHLMLHSSLKSIGYVQGGAKTVVDSLLQVLGDNGTLMVPTFTHSDTKYYDPRKSPSKNGAITEEVRKRPSSVRSLHPSHAVTVIGPDSNELVFNDLNCEPLGKGCALDILSKREGRILLLGVNQEVNSIIHVGEYYANDPDRHKLCSPDKPISIIINHPKHGEEVFLITSMMGKTIAFEQMENVLRKNGQIVYGKLGKALCQLMKASDVINATLDILKNDINDNLN
tara:strand:+ start:10666 stop:11412 length:747 start_codon:yes stop_codon:yes gene_type:complete